MYLWWSLCTLYLHACQVRCTKGCTSGGIYVHCIYCVPGESCRRRLRSLLLYLCDVFRALIISLVLILHEHSGPHSVSVHVYFYHWRELPQVSFLSRHTFCRDKHVFVTTNMCLSRQSVSFVTTKVCLSRQNFCRDKVMFVVTKLCLSL